MNQYLPLKQAKQLNIMSLISKSLYENLLIVQMIRAFNLIGIDFIPDKGYPSCLNISFKKCVVSLAFC